MHQLSPGSSALPAPAFFAVSDCSAPVLPSASPPLGAEERTAWPPNWLRIAAIAFMVGASSWREGTVIRSWLLDLMVAALDEDPGLGGIRGYAEDSGEGRWTVEAAIDNAVPVPALTAALFARFVSRQDDSPAMKAIAAMRNQFGGHAVHTPPPPGGEANPG